MGYRLDIAMAKSIWYLMPRIYDPPKHDVCELIISPIASLQTYEVSHSIAIIKVSANAMRR